MLSDSFWSKVEKTDACWNWIACVIASGYGQFCVGDGRRVRAHRFAYEEANGAIPAGLVLDHLCRNRRCVNPQHLQAVTNRTNVLRGIGPTAVRAAQTHCIHGHEFTPSNTIRRRGSQRDCRACKNEWERRARRNKVTAMVAEAKP